MRGTALPSLQRLTGAVPAAGAAPVPLGEALALLREHGPPALIGPPLTVVAHSAGEVRDEIRE